MFGVIALAEFLLLSKRYLPCSVLACVYVLLFPSVALAYLIIGLLAVE
jgi:hypothetical protein